MPKEKYRQYLNYLVSPKVKAEVKTIGNTVQGANAMALKKFEFIGSFTFFRIFNLGFQYITLKTQLTSIVTSYR
jgi:hypothetical protein